MDRVFDSFINFDLDGVSGVDEGDFFVRVGFGGLKDFGSGGVSSGHDLCFAM